MWIPGDAGLSSDTSKGSKVKNIMQILHNLRTEVPYAAQIVKSVEAHLLFVILGCVNKTDLT